MAHEGEVGSTEEGFFGFSQQHVLEVLFYLSVLFAEGLGFMVLDAPGVVEFHLDLLFEQSVMVHLLL